MKLSVVLQSAAERRADMPDLNTETIIPGTQARYMVRKSSGRSGKLDSFMSKKYRALNEEELQGALSPLEWRRFRTAVSFPQDSAGLCIVRNAVLLYNEEAPTTSKLICYRGGKANTQIIAVFKLIDYDWTIHEGSENPAAVISKGVKNGYEKDDIAYALRYDMLRNGYILEEYSAEDDRFVKFTIGNGLRGGNKGAVRSDRTENDGTGLSGDDSGNGDEVQGIKDNTSPHKPGKSDNNSFMSRKSTASDADYLEAVNRDESDSQLPAEEVIKSIDNNEYSEDTMRSIERQIFADGTDMTVEELYDELPDIIEALLVDNPSLTFVINEQAERSGLGMGFAQLLEDNEAASRRAVERLGGKKTQRNRKNTRKMTKQELIDSYTEEQYNNFGWATYNDVINTLERETLLSNYSEKVDLDFKYPTNRYGETLLHSTRTPDVLIYVKGSTASPKIVRVIRINAPEYLYQYISEEIVENERKGYFPAWETAIDYFGEGILGVFAPRDYDTYWQAKARTKRGGGRKSDLADREQQNRRGSTSSDKRNDKTDVGDNNSFMSRKSTASDSDYLEAVNRDESDSQLPAEEVIKAIENNEYSEDTMRSIEQQIFADGTDMTVEELYDELPDIIEALLADNTVVLLINNTII